MKCPTHQVQLLKEETDKDFAVLPSLGLGSLVIPAIFGKLGAHVPNWYMLILASYDRMSHCICILKHMF